MDLKVFKSEFIKAMCSHTYYFSFGTRGFSPNKFASKLPKLSPSSRLGPFISKTTAKIVHFYRFGRFLKFFYVHSCNWGCKLWSKCQISSSLILEVVYLILDTLTGFSCKK